MSHYNRNKIIFAAFSAVALFAAQINTACAAKSSGAQFLNLGSGGRALGMGEAFTAVADDVSGAYYNPAGIAGKSRESEMLFSHALQLEDTSISQFSFMRRPYSVSLIYFSAGSFEGRDDNANPTGNFKARDIALAVSRGFALGALKAGVTAKYINQRIKTSEATAFAADFGLLYRFKDSPFSVGTSLSNFGTEVKFNSIGFPLPLRFHLGVAALLKEPRLLLALDGEVPNDASAALKAGLEYSVLKGLAFRFGYRTTTGTQRDAVTGAGFGGASNSLSDFYGFYAGIGFAYENFNFDYALLPYGNLGAAHRFALTAKF